MEHRKRNLNIILIFGILFLVVTVLLLLVFFAGKKTYVVEFDLNGGTLVSGDLVQQVTQGQAAKPPVVEMENGRLKEWSEPYNKITQDVVISAVWIYDTTPGIIYANSSNQNFVEITGAYVHIRGAVYLGDSYGDKKILGIQDNAFKGYTQITSIRLPESLIHIGSGAFKGCTGLTAVEIPPSVTTISANAFSGCTALEQIVLSEGLLEIGKAAFKNCRALKEIVIPASVVSIAADAFDGCDDLIIRTSVSKEDKPEGWASGWLGSAGVIWLDAEDVIETETEEETFIRFPIRDPIFPIIRPTETTAEDEIEVEEPETEEETFIRFPIRDPIFPVIRPTETTAEVEIEVEEPEESEQPNDPEDATETETETEEETFIRFPIRDPLRPGVRPTDPTTEESVEVEIEVKESVPEESTTGE